MIPSLFSSDQSFQYQQQLNIGSFQRQSVDCREVNASGTETPAACPASNWVVILIQNVIFELSLNYIFYNLGLYLS